MPNCRPRNHAFKQSNVQKAKEEETVGNSKANILAMGCPRPITKLVNLTPISLWFMVDTSNWLMGLKTNKHHWGAPPCFLDHTCAQEWCYPNLKPSSWHTFGADLTGVPFFRRMACKGLWVHFFTHVYTTCWSKWLENLQGGAPQRCLSVYHPIT